MAWTGKEWQARLGRRGKDWIGEERRGKAGADRRGMAWQGADWQARNGVDGHGPARIGRDRQGKAGAERKGISIQSW